MCNAHNHSIYCDCGFGGDTGGGGRRSYTRAWSLWRDWEPITHLTTCWWCEAPVFFYRDENGGCALFDELGAPWKVHACWQDHRSQRRDALLHTNRDLQARGFSGGVSMPGERAADPPLRSNVCRSFLGFPSTSRGFSRTRTYLGVRTHDRGPFRQVDIVRSDTKETYPSYVPAEWSNLIPENAPVQLDGRWLDVPSQGMVFVVTSAERKFINGRVRFRRAIPDLVKQECRFCGRETTGSRGWSFDSDYCIQCETCGNMRGTLSAKDFVKQCARIVEHTGRRLDDA